MKAKVMAAVLACCLSAVVHAQSAEAERLYQQTRYQAALAILKQQSQAPAVLFLTGKCWYYAGDFKKAVESFERAAASDPRNAAYQNWLGKAWGRRAENANVFQAPGFASRAREAFEKAVALDSTHLESLNDLFQYYLEAPGLLGGGLDKARGLLPRIKQADPAEYHSALAQSREDEKITQGRVPTAPRRRLAPVWREGGRSGPLPCAPGEREGSGYGICRSGAEMARRQGIGVCPSRGLRSRQTEHGTGQDAAGPLPHDAADARRSAAPGCRETAQASRRVSVRFRDNRFLNSRRADSRRSGESSQDQ